MPHPCARQTTNAPNQTPCHRTQTAPPTHLRMRRAKTTNKHNTTNNKQTHHHRNAPDGTLLAAPTLTQPAKPRRIPRRDQRGRNTQTATKKHTRNTHHSAKHAKPPRTCTHDRHKPKRTSTSPSSPHAQARSLDRRGARKQARPRRAQRTRTQQSAATQTPRNTMSAERKTREDAAHLPPLPFLLVSRLVADADLSLSLSLSLSSALTPRASRRSPLAGGNRHACNHATRQAARTAAAQRETVPRSRRRVPTPAALGARA